MFGVQREMQVYLLSLEKLEKYKDCFDTIYPSHGPFPVRPELIDASQDGTKWVLAGEIQRTDKELFVTRIKRHDVGVAGFLCDC